MRRTATFVQQNKKIGNKRKCPKGRLFYGETRRLLETESLSFSRRHAEGRTIAGARSSTPRNIKIVIIKSDETREGKQMLVFRRWNRMIFESTLPGHLQQHFPALFGGSKLWLLASFGGPFYSLHSARRLRPVLQIVLLFPQLGTHLGDARKSITQIVMTCDGARYHRFVFSSFGRKTDSLVIKQPDRQFPQSNLWPPNNKLSRVGARVDTRPVFPLYCL